MRPKTTRYVGVVGVMRDGGDVRNVVATDDASGGYDNGRREGRGFGSQSRGLDIGI